ncbi:hypothetical protein P7J26_01705 [Streptococcus suis]
MKGIVVAFQNQWLDVTYRFHHYFLSEPQEKADQFLQCYLIKYLLKLGLAFQLECILQAFAVLCCAVLCCAVLCCAHGNLLFIGCQAVFDNVDKKLSNEFSL